MLHRRRLVASVQGRPQLAQQCAIPWRIRGARLSLWRCPRDCPCAASVRVVASGCLCGVQAVRREAPRIGGSFAVWGGLFSTFDCTLVAVRRKVRRSRRARWSYTTTVSEDVFSATHELGHLSLLLPSLLCPAGVPCHCPLSARADLRHIGFNVMAAECTERL